MHACKPSLYVHGGEAKRRGSVVLILQPSFADSYSGRPCRLSNMGSRYAALSAQQAKLSALFRGAGYIGELPSFLTGGGAGADHPLLSWMASNLSLEANFMPEHEANEAKLALAGR